MDRTEWLCYMIGYMTSKGWELPKEDANNFKVAFPEIPQEYIDIVVEKEKCGNCKECVKYCPMGLDPTNQIITDEECIKCLYCYCVCPQKAISLEGRLGFFANQVNRYDRTIRKMVSEN